jgi:AraC-like DNA-binding protein
MQQMYSIENDFFLVDNLTVEQPYAYTFDPDMIVAVVCTNGSAINSINKKYCNTLAPSITVARPGDILQYQQVSKDFQGFIVLLSTHFANNLLPNPQEKAALQLAIGNNPARSLNSTALHSTLDYFHLIKQSQFVDDTQLRKKIVGHLTLAFYYTITSQSPLHYHSNNFTVNQFVKLVQENFTKQRNVAFYAQQLCLTTKYLAKIVKLNSGYSPKQWINHYVAAEAQQLLHSTNLTVQQIGDKLNFTSSTSFGKYFKRIEGVAPSEYNSLPDIIPSRLL